MEELKTGWERSRRGHFDEIVSTYDSIRPDYPEKIFEDIFDYVKGSDGKKALEIGAGTGKATLPFLEGGYDVNAVEIGENMSEFLRERFKERDNFNVVTDSFENALLEESAYDLIYAATAFHWVDAKIGCPKALGLLKPGGGIALFRYNALVPLEGKIYDEIQAEYEKHYYSFYESSYRPKRKSFEDYKSREEIYIGFRFYDLKDYGFEDIRMNFYENSRDFTADEYMMLLDTFSDHRVLPEENRLALYAGIKDAILRNGGVHKVDYVFQLYMGRRPA